MNTTNNPKKVAIVLAVSTVFSLGLLTYSFKLKSELNELQKKQVELLEESLEKEKRIKKLEAEVISQEFRAKHFQDLYEQQELVNQETLKKLKWK
jgi:hypothetical protein